MQRALLVLALIGTVLSLQTSVAFAEPSARAAIQSDLQATVAQRACLKSRETPGKSKPYIALNDQGSGAKGAYQYMDYTWRYVLAAAESSYGVNISSADNARDATPYAQDVVTAFAIAHKEELKRLKKPIYPPWPYCY